MKKKILLVLSVFVLASLISGTVFAFQVEPTLNLGLIRNFGYGGLGKIQGSFTLRIVDPPADLKEVNFYMDGELMDGVSEIPFQTKFSTGDFPDGEHQMSAQGILDDGSEVFSNTVTKVFLSSEQAWSETGTIIVPLLAGIVVLSLIGVGAPFLFGRKREHTPGKYGPAGGAVCPRCGLPFSRPFFAPNLAIGKLVRCPHCGKISILPAALPARLKEAESRYAEKESPQITTGRIDDISKMIEDSRFED